MLPGPTELTCFGSSWTWLPLGTQWVMLGNVLLIISYWIQWKHIHHLRKREAFFQDLFGCNWISLQNEEGCTDRKQDALKNAWFPHEGVCEITWQMVTRCWRPVCVPWFWHLTTPILPGPGWLVHGLGLPLQGCTLPTPPLHTPKGPRGATSDAKFQPGGPICKIKCYSLKKQARKTVISR